MNGNTRPILLASEGISYCHVVRPLIIGRWLKELKLPIIVACPQPHQAMFAEEGFATIPIETADPKTIYHRLAKGHTLYNTQELLTYFEQDEQLLKEVDPQLIVADFRFTLMQLARRCGIPSVGITSASCHPSFRLDGTTPNPFVRPAFLPAGFFDALQRTVIGKVTRKLLVAELSRPYRQASRKYGLPVLPTFFDYASQGDLCLLSDHPLVMPLDKLRPQDLYTGALIWERDTPLPPALQNLPADRKTVYVTVGTQESLSLDFLDELLSQLLKDGYTVVLSKGTRPFEVSFQHDRLLVFDFLNEAKLLPKIDLYVYHGSAMSTYHGLYYGVPMISIPVQADQHFHSEALIRLGVGTLFRPVHLKINELTATVHRMMNDPGVRDAARRVQQQLQSYHQAAETCDRIRRLCSPGQVALALGAEEKLSSQPLK
ncbi:MAG: glycosyltransferase [Pirellulaceae bacterium]